MPSLATTARGRAWLANFSDGEKSVARRLLDGLEMVSDSRFRREMKDLIARTRGSNETSVVAAYSVHGLPKSFAPHYFGCAVPHARRPPLLCPSTKLTGSEAIVQNLLRKSGKALNILVDCTVEDLYNVRADRILLVTDNIASGQEVEAFLSFVEANPRLRSWQSFGWTQLEIVTHSISESALLRLNRRTVVHFEHLSRTFETTDWRASEVEEIRALCKRYSSIKKQGLGWRSAESLLVFGHTFGNGTPAILRQQVGPGGIDWSPLLPHDRDYGLTSPDAAAMQHYRAPHSFMAMLSKLTGTITGQMPRVERLAQRTRWERLFGEYSVPVMVLIAAISAGHRYPIDLMKAGSMSLSRLQDVARVAHELRLIDGYPDLVISIGEGNLTRDSGSGRDSARPGGLRLSRRGQGLLRRRARAKRIQGNLVDLSADEAREALEIREVVAPAETRPTSADPPEPYYPQQLR